MRTSENKEGPKEAELMEAASVQPQVNSFTGTLSYSIPLEITKARDLTPELALSYYSRGGHGLFGMGFDLSVLKISRSAGRGIPSYNDDQDVFVLSGEEELVVKDTRTNGSSKITFYEPRVKNNGRRIEYWRNSDDATQSYWIVREVNGVNHIFGRNLKARISDPDNNSHIFTWLLETSFDAKGNQIVYQYESDPNNPNRYLSSIYYGNLKSYVEKNEAKRNEEEKDREIKIDPKDYAFEIRFGYENDVLKDDIKESGSSHHTPYNSRKDQIISYRSGFEIQTQRLCRNIYLLHRFESEFSGEPFLVKRWELQYELDEKIQMVNLLKSVQQYGYRKLKSENIYLSKSMPTTTFDYTQCAFKKEFGNNTLNFQSGSVPSNATSFRFIDLYREGLPGILYSDRDTTLYWRNRPIVDEQGVVTRPSFNAPELLGEFPIERSLGSYRHQIMDIPGTDQLALVVREMHYGGFYENHEEGNWSNFQTFEDYPSEFIHPTAEFLDINGSGNSDLVLIDIPNPVYYPALGKKGFAPPKPLQFPSNFPVNSIHDPSQYVSFANLLGDGLSHRVRITQKVIEYWPNLGGGRFGDSHSVPAPNWPDEFDSSYLFLVDTKGSGTPDLIYLHAKQPDRLLIYFNKGGGRFNQTAHEVQLPDGLSYSADDRLRFADVLGKGVPTFIFSKSDANNRHYYSTFTPQQKPFVLNRIDNHCGATAEILYQSSVVTYLQDIKDNPQAENQTAGKATIAVQVVDQVKVTENIRNLELIQRYRYHDGYYDSYEREFVGFGFVEEWDHKKLKEEAPDPNPLAPPPMASVYVKRWYSQRFTSNHIIKDTIKQSKANDSISTEFLFPTRSSFYTPDQNKKNILNQVLSLVTNTPDKNIFSQQLKDEDFIRQAHMAAKGHLLHEEIYGDDGSPTLKQHPYTATASNVAIRCLKLPVRQNGILHNGIFEILPRETITYNYERRPNDPKITHQFYLAWDQHHNLKDSALVYYPRKFTATESSTTAEKKSETIVNAEIDAVIRKDLYETKHPEQASCKIIADCKDYLNRAQGKSGSLLNPNEFQYLGAVIQTRQFEIVEPPVVVSVYTFDQVDQVVQTARSSKSKDTLLHYEKIFYINDDAQTRSEFPLLLSYTKTVVESNAWFSQVYGETFKTISLEESGYILEDGYWWQPSVITEYGVDEQESQQPFYLPTRTSFNGTLSNSDPTWKKALWSKTTISYDAPYYLAILEQKHYLLKEVDKKSEEVGVVIVMNQIDYHTLKPHTINDANQIQHQVLYDPLGAVVAISTYKKPKKTADQEAKKIGNECLDETLLKILTSIPEKEISATLNNTFLNKLLTQSDQDLIKNYLTTAGYIFFYNLHAYRKDDTETIPNWRLKIARTQFQNPESGIDGVSCEPATSLMMMLEYQDGLGTLVQSKIKTDAGLALSVDKTSKKITEILSATRWLVSGFIKHNDRGLPIEEYLPYYSSSAAYEDRTAFQEKKPTLLVAPYRKYYDALARLIQTQNPDGTITKIKIDSWYSIYFDENDNSLDELHHHTPQIKLLDVQGNAFLQLDLLKKSGIPGVELLKTHTAYDALKRPVRLTDPRLYELNIPNISFDYDQLGQIIRQNSVDSGEKKNLFNCYQKLITQWDQRQYVIRLTYDHWQRVTGKFIAGGKSDVSEGFKEYQHERMIYGDLEANAEDKNLYGKIIRCIHQGGIQHFDAYDIQGNCITSHQQFYIFDRKQFDAGQKTINCSSDSLPISPQKFAPLRVRFDAVNRMIALQEMPSTQSFRDYNRLGQLINLKCRNALGQEQILIRETDYYAVGQRARILYGSNIATHFNFEASTQRLQQLKTSKVPIAALEEKEITFQDIYYQYDFAGNITKINDQTCPQFQNWDTQSSTITPQEYKYDTLNRLSTANTKTKASGLGSSLSFFTAAKENYGYDNGSNLVARTSKIIGSNETPTAVAANYGIHKNEEKINEKTSKFKASNRVTTISNPEKNNKSTEFTYDLVGNLIQEQQGSTTTTHIWHALNQLIHFKNATVEEFYFYDQNNQRVRKITFKTENDKTIKLDKFYLGNYEIVHEYQDPNSSKFTVKESLRIFDHKRCVATYRPQLKDRDWTYHFVNHLGSITVELDKNANPLTYEEFNPFGDTSFIDGHEAAIKDKNYRYSGKEQDATGQYYYGARYYSPTLGRWTSTDPAGLIDGLNFYGFVKNNPITFFDAIGLTKNETYFMLERFTEGLKVGSSLQKESNAFLKRYAAAEEPALERKIFDQYKANLLLYGKPIKDIKALNLSIRSSIRMTRIFNNSGGLIAVADDHGDERITSARNLAMNAIKNRSIDVLFIEVPNKIIIPKPETHKNDDEFIKEIDQSRMRTVMPGSVRPPPLNIIMKQLLELNNVKSSRDSRKTQLAELLAEHLLTERLNDRFKAVKPDASPTLHELTQEAIKNGIEVRAVDHDYASTLRLAIWINKQEKSSRDLLFNFEGLAIRDRAAAMNIVDRYENNSNGQMPRGLVLWGQRHFEGYQYNTRNTRQDNPMGKTGDFPKALINEAQRRGTMFPIHIINDNKVNQLELPDAPPNLGILFGD